MNKLERNSPCWCGSGKKYKKCHLKEEAQERKDSSKAFKPSAIRRDSEYIEGMKASCRLAKATLLMVEERIKVGLTTNQIDQLVYEFTLDHGAYPATLNYNGFPKSCCTSINDVICHGIPDDRVIIEGDIVNVDVTCILDGFFGDTNKTFLMENCSDDAKKITDISKECLRLGIEAAQPYGRIGDIGAVIQKYANSLKCSVVEKFVGHGIGKKFHQEPQVPHFGKFGTGEVILPGMFFTIEPMINLGKKGVRILKDDWTAVTVDGKLSAQYEHTIFITEQGNEVLTV